MVLTSESLRARLVSSGAERVAGLIAMGDPNDCWLWQGHLHVGYGRVLWNGYRWLAHRLVSVLCFGELPDGVFVLHRCDNPQCCNPNHLWRGSLADNNHDRDRKGRAGLPSSTKLTRDDVARLRTLRIEGAKVQDLAKEFGVSRNNVYAIVKRKTWRYL